MGYGFKEIFDLSPLSIKNLNDQLYMLWRKVMGGISESDILDGESEKIVEKGITNIDIGVGAVAGTNLVRNGRGNHGTEGYSTISTGTLLSEEDDSINKKTFVALGEFIQTDIPLTPGEDYCVGCNIDTNEGDVTLGIYCQLTNSSSTARDITSLSEVLNTDGFDKKDFTFTAPNEIKSCLISFSGASEYKVTDILIKEGEAFSEWTPHEGEVYSSGISISKESVSISSPNFDLNILDPADPDPDNPLISMSAASGGFNKIVTENLEMKGNSVVSFTDEASGFYVNPAHTNASDANPGDNSDYPLFTINGALKRAGRVANNSTYIFLASGTTYREKLRIVGYQGLLTFCMYDGLTHPVIYGTGSEGIIIESCNMVKFKQVDFYCFFDGQPDYTDEFCDYCALSYRYSKGAVEDSLFYCDVYRNGVGVELIHSSCAIKDYQMNDFKYLCIVKPNSWFTTKDGVGQNQEGFIMYSSFAHMGGTRPKALVSHERRFDGAVLYGSSGAIYAAPLTNVQSPDEYTYYPTFSGSWGDDDIVTSNPSNIKQGEDSEGTIYTGVFGFSLTQMRSDLAGKTIQNVYLRLTRLSDLNSIRDIHLWGCDKTDISGSCPEKDDDYDYGFVCTFSGGNQTLEFGIGAGIVEDLLSQTAGTPNSLMINDDWFSPITILGYDQNNADKPLLRICV